MGAGPRFMWICVGSAVLFPYWACGKLDGDESGVALAAVEFIVSLDRRWLVRSAFIFE